MPTKSKSLNPVKPIRSTSNPLLIGQKENNIDASVNGILQRHRSKERKKNWNISQSPMWKNHKSYSTKNIRESHLEIYKKWSKNKSQIKLVKGVSDEKGVLNSSNQYTQRKNVLPMISRNTTALKESQTWNIVSKHESECDSRNMKINMEWNGKNNHSLLKLLDENKKPGDKKTQLMNKENTFNKKLEQSTTLRHRGQISFPINNQNTSYLNFGSIECENKYEENKESTNSSKKSDKEQQALQAQTKELFNSPIKTNRLTLKNDKKPWRILQRWCNEDRKDNAIIKSNSHSDEAESKPQTNINTKKLLSLSMIGPNEEEKKSYIKSYHVKSKPGRKKDGMIKTNQDSYLIETHIFNFYGFNIFGVFDGHGVNGHLASQFVSEYISSSIHNNLFLSSSKTWDEIYDKWTNKDYLIINNIFTSAEEELKHVDFDCSLSGTTSVIVFQIGKRIICANTGDSRAIVVNNSTGSNQPFSLSKDSKPELPSERKRIEKNGGCVEQYSEFGNKQGPFRVWLRNKNFPGLAMSRSIGDWIASSIGVIPTPEVIEYIIDDHTKYIIIASDGIWEFLNNNMVMKICNPYYDKNDPEKVCEALLSRSTKWWKREDIAIDDITVLTLFF